MMRATTPKRKLFLLDVSERRECKDEMLEMKIRVEMSNAYHCSTLPKQFFSVPVFDLFEHYGYDDDSDDDDCFTFRFIVTFSL